MAVGGRPCRVRGGAAASLRPRSALVAGRRRAARPTHRRLGGASLQRCLRPVARRSPHRRPADRLCLRGVPALPGAELMPSVSVRRPVSVALWLVVSTLVVLASPLLIALGKLASALTRRPQALIATRLMVAYFGYEPLLSLGAGCCGWAPVAGCDPHAPIAVAPLAVVALVHRRARRLGSADAPYRSGSGALDRGRDRACVRSTADRPQPPRRARDTIFIVDQLVPVPTPAERGVQREPGARPCIDLLGHRLPHALLDR